MNQPFDTHLNNNAFVLFPVIIPGWVSPVQSAENADGGVSIKLCTENPKGLVCLVDPWTEFGTNVATNNNLTIAEPFRSTPLAVGDRVELFVQGRPRPIDGHTVAPGEENDRVWLYIGLGILREGVNTLSYIVTRPSGNAQPSRELKVLFHQRAPGDPGPMRLLLPDDVIAEGIDAERAAAGVEVGFDYANTRPYDTVEFSAGRAFIERPVNDGETAPITQTYYTDFFQQVGDHPQTECRYTVYDQLGNESQSGVTYLDVHLSQASLLPAPDVSEDPDDPNDDPDTIDLDKLGRKDLTVSVHASTPPWQSGDVIRVIYTAAPPSGPVTEHVVTAVVSRLGFTYKLLIPNAKVLADSVVQVRYELVRADAVIAKSRITTAQVIGSGPIDLRPPLLVAPATNPIDPLAYASGITLRVEYLDSITGDRGHLLLADAPPGSPTYPSPILNANHRANFNVTQASLMALQNRTAEFSWELLRGGASQATSLPLVLTVNRIADGDTRLPLPVINGDIDDELDVTQLPGNAQLTSAPWTHVPNECMWLKYEGTDTNNAPVTLSDLAGIPNTTAPGLTRPAPVEWLKGLKDGTTLTVTLKVNFEGVANEATAVGFPVRRYSVKALTVPPLIIDTSPAAVDTTGYIFSHESRSFPFTIFTRAATGGIPPYTYSSSNSAFTTVNANILTQTRGSTIITVKDSTGQTASYTLTMTGHIYTIVSTGKKVWAAAYEYLATTGHKLLTRNELRAFILQHPNSYGISTDIWTIEIISPTQIYIMHFPGNGQEILGPPNQLLSYYHIA